jgi:large subunit ribosomal protein L4
VLSRRFAEERIVVLDKMDLQTAKTRDLKAAVDTLGIEGKALFVDVDARENANFARASRNVREWKLVDSLGVNAYDVLAHGTVVLSKGAFTRVVKNLGGE